MAEKVPHVVKSEFDPQDRWTNIVTWSDGRVERLPVQVCPCGLKRKHTSLSPMDCHMYALVLCRLVEFRQLSFVADKSTCTMAQLLDQFVPGNSWIDDTVETIFDCSKCGDRLSLYMDTYHGAAGLTRKP
jgi:hypothetical protein